MMDWQIIQRKLEAALEKINNDNPDWFYASYEGQARKLVEIMREDTQAVPS